MKRITIIAAALLATAPASAGDWLEAPRHYERAGLELDRAGLIDWIPLAPAVARMVCADTVACAVLALGRCTIWIDATLLRDRDLLDHERAHCAGWTHD